MNKVPFRNRKSQYHKQMEMQYLAVLLAGSNREFMFTKLIEFLQVGMVKF